MFIPLTFVTAGFPVFFERVGLLIFDVFALLGVCLLCVTLTVLYIACCAFGVVVYLICHVIRAACRHLHSGSSVQFAVAAVNPL